MRRLKDNARHKTFSLHEFLTPNGYQMFGPVLCHSLFATKLIKTKDGDSRQIIDLYTVWMSTCSTDPNLLNESQTIY